MSDREAWINHLRAAGGVVGPWRDGESILHFGSPQDEYRALTEAAGLVDLSTRTQIELTGEDRASFLHNLCTNEIRKLAVGAGCEAFITNAQAHILAHGLVFCRAESLVIDTVPQQGDRLMQHFDRYLIRERVELHDRTPEWADLLLAGPEATTLLDGLGLPRLDDAYLAHVVASLAEVDVSLRRVQFAPESYLLTCPRDQLATVWQTLVEAGARPCGQEAAEMCRLEMGFPEYGRDINDRHLPQEVGRDELAISFVKGCYIGQETVARIDALGHVNKLLVGLKFTDATEVPPPEAEVQAGEQAVGRVTSAVRSPQWAAPLALGYVRRGHHELGTQLDSAFGPVEVVRLPSLPAD